MTDGKLPLGIMRQAVMKMDSFISDIYECMEDDDLTNEQRATFGQIAEMAGSMQAAIVNMSNSEIEESEFINEQIPMDEIEQYPGSNDDLLDEPI